MEDAGKYERIKEVLEELSTSDLVSMHNEYCEADRCMDDYIFPMDEFDEVMEAHTPWEVARACYYSGKFCPAHDYFWFNAYGNCESADFPTEQISIDAIAEYIGCTCDSLHNDEIQKILNDYGKELE